MGRPRRSLLAPILRSEAQARVLAAVYLADEPLHVRAIAQRAEVPYAVAQREVARLEEQRLVLSTRVGNARLVRPNDDHPLYSELRSLLLKAYGPREVLAGLLANEQGIVDAYLFGSWAARYRGVPGEPPADVDVLAVGSPSLDRIDELERQAEEIIGRPVQITVAPVAEWDAATAPFLRTVKQRPLVRLWDDETR